jgi:beta-xylosidase
MSSRFSRRAAAFLLLPAAAMVLALTPSSTASAGNEGRFFADQPYTGEFASPAVLVDNGRYYAVATNEDGNNLPAMHSGDLKRWVARSPLPDYHKYRNWKGFNDAMPVLGSWAAKRHIDGRQRYALWAPALAKMGGRYVAAYAAVVNFRTNRLCIGLAYANHPLGKFTSPARKPLVCSWDPRGSIDPDLITANGKHYLIWKNAGVKGSKPTKMYSRQLNGSATGFAPGSRSRLLLSTQQRWEGNVIEQPDMVAHAGRFYLFYSGNSYTRRSYATGYAVCKSPLGPCSRVRSTPLIKTNSAVVAPGGAAPFVDLQGRLRLAYHAWSTAQVGGGTPRICNGCPPRRLHIATLGVQSNGHLKVTRLR